MESQLVPLFVGALVIVAIAQVQQLNSSHSLQINGSNITESTTINGNNVYSKYKIQKNPLLANNQPGRGQVRQCSSCACGLQNTNKIVGGTEVHSNKYPWMAQLIRNGQFFCGGSLINDRYVATASHCVKGLLPQTLSVRLLEYNRAKSTVIVRKVSRAITHPAYNPSTINNDIALLRLNEAVPIKGLMRPICLPNAANRFSQTLGVVAGWGTKSQYGRPSNILHEVQVPIMSNEQCRRTIYSSKITNEMICAGYKEGKKDACQGDSGGPLMVRGKSAYQLAGIVSYGNGCALPNSPGVYARVTEFLKWIKDNTKDACYCTTVPQ